MKKLLFGLLAAISLSTDIAVASDVASSELTPPVAQALQESPSVTLIADTNTTPETRDAKPEFLPVVIGIIIVAEPPILYIAVNAYCNATKKC